MNAIPVIGWIISLILNTSLAIPFWFLWTACGLGAKYFYFLPDLYLRLPFWHCVGLIMVCEIIKQCFIPKFASVSQSADQKK